MAKHTGKHSAKRSKAAGVAAFLVLLFSGFLLSTNLRVNRSVVVSNDTAELVEQRVKKVNSLRSEIDALSTRVNDLSKTLDSQNADGSQDSESAGNGTMLPAVEGPGLVVTLDDSPLWENMVDANGSSANINDYVVHQQDIEAVVNALWAEAPNPCRSWTSAYCSTPPYAAPATCCCCKARSIRRRSKSRRSDQWRA